MFYVLCVRFYDDDDDDNNNNNKLHAGLAIEDVISAKIVYDEYMKQSAAASQLPSFLFGYNKL